MRFANRNPIKDPVFRALVGLRDPMVDVKRNAGVRVPYKLASRIEFLKLIK